MKKRKPIKAKDGIRDMIVKRLTFKSWGNVKPTTK
jgi:hypothetical protein